jgi:hypothetical protein
MFPLKQTCPRTLPTAGQGDTKCRAAAKSRKVKKNAVSLVKKDEKLLRQITREVHLIKVTEDTYSVGNTSKERLRVFEIYPDAAQLATITVKGKENVAVACNLQRIKPDEGIMIWRLSCGTPEQLINTFTSLNVRGLTKALARERIIYRVDDGLYAIAHGSYSNRKILDHFPSAEVMSRVQKTGSIQTFLKKLGLVPHKLTGTKGLALFKPKMMSTPHDVILDRIAHHLSVVA